MSDAVTRLNAGLKGCYTIERELDEGGMATVCLTCRQKGPARATKYFSGNGVSVAAMCAVLHQYRPVAANEGGQHRGIPHAFILHRPTQTRNSGRAEQCWIAVDATEGG